MNRRLPFVLRALLLAMLALAAVAHAQTPTADKPSLTREQIEQCLLDRRDVVALNRELSTQKARLDERSTALLATESRLQQSRQWLDSQHRALQAQQDELQRHGDDMAAYLSQVGAVRKSADEYQAHVARYNDEVRAHQQLLDQYNIDVAALNQQLERLDAKAHETDGRCVKAPVRRADLDAAKAAVDEKSRTSIAPATRVIP